MSVTEVASALGEWSLKLAENTPLYLLNKLGYFGHIAITPGRIDPEDYGDSLLKSARYVGVNYGRGFGSDNKTLKGTGMAVWLGDSDDKGYTIEEPITFTNSTFQVAFTALIPPSLTVGTIAPLPGLYNDVVTFKSRRKAMDYLCGLYNAEWRVNGDGSVDAGLISDLYVSNPKAAVIRNRDGLEMDYKALKGLAKLDSDVTDFTTRVLLLAEGTEASTVTATADILPGLNPYKDLFGAPVVWTRIVSETATSTANAPARAQLQLNRFTSPKDSLTLSTAQFDVKGDVSAGDWLWVYDSDALLIDENNEIEFHQEKIYPLKLRLFQLSWPITSKMGVVFRTDDGEWIDLTDYVIPESGETSLTVGGYNRSLTGQGTAPGDSPGSRPTVDTTIPDVVDWVLPFSQSTYQSDSGETKAQIVLAWTQPLNVGGSIIMDGGWYEIRWRTSATGVYDITHDDLSAYTHAELTGTQASPIPYTQGPWQSTQVGFDNNQFLLQDLTPGIPYEFQIRAVDSATPPNVGDWSSNQPVQTRPDTTAPSTPASCETIAGSRNAFQIVHTLGKASGGTFNLESDLNHLKIHVGFSADFIPVNDSPLDGGTLAGKVPANQGMLRGQIPVVATFQLDEVPDQTRYIKVVAVDNYGNESGPSAASVQTAELLDSAFISELTVSKVSAGTILADWIQAATIATALTGARVKLGWIGIEAYNLSNIRTFYVNSATGDVTIIGKFIASDPIGNPGDSITMWPSYPGASYPTIEFVSSGAGVNTGPAFMNALPGFAGNGTALGLNSGWSASLPTNNQSTLILGGQSFFLQYNTANPVPNNPLGGRVYGDSDVAVLQRWISGAITGGITIQDEPRYERLGTENAGNGGCGIDLTANGIKMYAAGIYVLQTRYSGDTSNAYTESFQFSGPGASAFRGQLGGSGNFGKSFSVRTTSADANAILDVDGKTSVFVKNFVIDHPEDADRWLVHACTEGPTAGVEYSGKVEINNYMAIVELPPYFEAATRAENRQIFLQVQLPEDGSLYPFMPRAICSPIRGGKFMISSDGFDGTIVGWLVKAVRSDVPQFPVTPLKSEWQRVGEAPYTHLEKM